MLDSRGLLSKEKRVPIRKAREHRGRHHITIEKYKHFSLQRLPRKLIIHDLVEN